MVETRSTPLEAPHSLSSLISSFEEEKWYSGHLSIKTNLLLYKEFQWTQYNGTPHFTTHFNVKVANKNIRLFYWKSTSSCCHILFYLKSNPQVNLGFLGQKGRITSLSFLGFMSDHQLNTTLLASSNICCKPMDVLWTLTNVSSLVSSLMEVVIWMRFPKMGSFEIAWSLHGDMVWSDIHGVLLPNHALNRQALSLIIGENLLILFPWGYSNGDTHNGFRLHTLSVVYEFLVKGNTW